jgi:hypothetical protein
MAVRYVSLRHLERSTGSRIFFAEHRVSRRRANYPCHHTGMDIAMMAA